MSFRKPFQAVPIKPSPQYMRKRRAQQRMYGWSILIFGGLLGILAGAGSIAATAAGRTRLVELMKPVGVSLGFMRARAPQPGDYWPGCNSARAAGTAPIYDGEPGYREEMDGDGDGIACEPHHGI